MLQKTVDRRLFYFRRRDVMKCFSAIMKGRFRGKNAETIGFYWVLRMLVILTCYLMHVEGE